MSEWKPGDVAVIRLHDDSEHTAINIAEDCWHSVREDGDLRCTLDSAVARVRPLVVIDPEDAEQVERLRVAWELAQYADLDNSEPMTMAALRMRAALREFANPTPPKPDEPGLYGVVLDAGGAEWLRVQQAPGAPAWRLIDGGPYTAYADIDAVRVLSEGVQP